MGGAIGLLPKERGLPAWKVDTFHGAAPSFWLKNSMVSSIIGERERR